MLPGLNRDSLRSAMKRGVIPLQIWSEEMTGKSRPAYHDLIAELTFAGFRSLVSNGEAPTEAWRPSEEDLECALIVMSVIRGERLDREKVDSCMMKDASVLVNRLHYHLVARLSDLTFQPRLKGYGNLASCHPDLMTSMGVIELKTSAYSLRVEDFRQVLLYSFLCGENKYPYRILSLINPRLGRTVCCDVDEFCFLFGGGNSGMVFEKIRQALCT